MDRVPSHGDDAAMESLLSWLQENVLDLRRWATRHELQIEILTWIERTFNRRRRQCRLGQLTPVVYELAFCNTDEPAGCRHNHREEKAGKIQAIESAEPRQLVICFSIKFLCGYSTICRDTFRVQAFR